MGTELQIDWQGRWRLSFVYGYPHDSSNWRLSLTAERRESPDAFARRVNLFMEERFEPEEDGRGRLSTNRLWSERYKALRNLFWDGHHFGEWDHQLTDLLLGIKGMTLTEAKIKLTAHRLATLRRWANESAKEKP